MKRKEKPMMDKLGLDPELEPPIELEEINVVSKGSVEDVKEDYEKLRESLISSIIRGNEAIDDVCIEIKKGSSAMMVTGLAALLKSSADSTKALLDLHKEIRLLEKKEESTDVTEKKTVKTNLNDIIELAKEREKRVANSK